MKHIIPILVILLLLPSGFVGVCNIPLTAYNAVGNSYVDEELRYLKNWRGGKTNLLGES